MHGCTHAAIEIARKLGVQYLWIDSLCIVHDDQDDLMKALSTMSNIYSSAILTICVDEDEDGTAQCLVNRPVLLRPFSIFLNWSQPAYAVDCRKRLLTPSRASWGWSNRGWLIKKCTCHSFMQVWKIFFIQNAQTCWNETWDSRDVSSQWGNRFWREDLEIWSGALPPTRPTRSRTWRCAKERSKSQSRQRNSVRRE